MTSTQRSADSSVADVETQLTTPRRASRQAPLSVQPSPHSPAQASKKKHKDPAIKTSRSSPRKRTKSKRKRKWRWTDPSALATVALSIYISCSMINIHHDHYHSHHHHFYLHHDVGMINPPYRSSHHRKSQPSSFLNRKRYDICIVGAGLSGSVLAERYASQHNASVLVMEQRDHIGGNCYDYIDDETDIRVSKYGAHIFHTSYERVWDYLQQFTNWTPYEHEVVGSVGLNGTIVPIPVNIETVNALFGLEIQNTQEMDEWLAKEQVKYDNPIANSEEMALSRVGPRLYDLIFKPYTEKQWGTSPRELGPEVTARIPVRNNHDKRYFTDPHQALPSDGYTAMFRNMLNHPKIDVQVNTNYFDIKDDIDCDHRTYYTGPIDVYFSDLGWDKLEYRSLDFERKVLKNVPQFQSKPVVNHPSSSANFTRIVEYKHFLNQSSPHTVIFYEHSKAGGEPYYPVPNDRNRKLYQKYQSMAEATPNVSFVGRLANYKYFNMDQAILNALEIFDKDSTSFGGGGGGASAV
ncbi:unnamed protein product [Cylindrotheca closterium]|uniref:UDP-galactopyranose mutase C-terminal domain-containing protein n=1 Tax=Cylindrotheca closterium TaxID=2856 RepID=A0AAD2JKX5_9STRA|nr:unnamed protein product [Cylindrotheca closterium]